MTEKSSYQLFSEIAKIGIVCICIIIVTGFFIDGYEQFEKAKADIADFKLQEIKAIGHNDSATEKYKWKRDSLKFARRK